MNKKLFTRIATGVVASAMLAAFAGGSVNAASNTDATEDIPGDVVSVEELSTEVTEDSFTKSLEAYKNVLTEKGNGVGAFVVTDVNHDGSLDLYYVDSANDVEEVYIFVDGDLYKSVGMNPTNIEEKIVANYERNYYLVNPDYYNHTGNFAE